MCTLCTNKAVYQTSIDQVCLHCVTLGDGIYVNRPVQWRQCDSLRVPICNILYSFNTALFATETVFLCIYTTITMMILDLYNIHEDSNSRTNIIIMLQQ